MNFQNSSKRYDIDSKEYKMEAKTESTLLSKDLKEMWKNLSSFLYFLENLFFMYKI